MNNKRKLLTLGVSVIAFWGATHSIASDTRYAMPMDNTRVVGSPNYDKTNRPLKKDRLFRSQAVDNEIIRVKNLLKNPKLAWMFENCFPNTLDTTVRHRKTNGKDDTVVYTGDIHAMWLRDSGAQVWPYVQLANSDPQLKAMLAGVIRRQFMCINIDPYANAFLDPHDPNPDHQWMSDMTDMKKELHERKWEIDSLCYPLRLAYHYWKTTGDASIFDEEWLQKHSKNNNEKKAQDPINFNGKPNAS